jgi:hypothetical protein
MSVAFRALRIIGLLGLLVLGVVQCQVRMMGTTYESSGPPTLGGGNPPVESIPDNEIRHLLSFPGSLGFEGFIERDRPILPHNGPTEITYQMGNNPQASGDVQITGSEELTKELLRIQAAGVKEETFEVKIYCLDKNVCFDEETETKSVEVRFGKFIESAKAIFTIRFRETEHYGVVDMMLVVRRNGITFDKVRFPVVVANVDNVILGATSSEGMLRTISKAGNPEYYLSSVLLSAYQPDVIVDLSRVPGEDQLKIKVTVRNDSLRNLIPEDKQSIERNLPLTEDQLIDRIMTTQLALQCLRVGSDQIRDAIVDRLGEDNCRKASIAPIGSPAYYKVVGRTFEIEGYLLFLLLFEGDAADFFLRLSGKTREDSSPIRIAVDGLKFHIPWQLIFMGDPGNTNWASLQQSGKYPAFWGFQFIIINQNAAEIGSSGPTQIDKPINVRNSIFAGYSGEDIRVSDLAKSHFAALGDRIGGTADPQIRPIGTKREFLERVVKSASDDEDEINYIWFYSHGVAHDSTRSYADLWDRISAIIVDAIEFVFGEGADWSEEERKQYVAYQSSQFSAVSEPQLLLSGRVGGPADGTETVVPSKLSRDFLNTADALRERDEIAVSAFAIARKGWLPARPVVILLACEGAVSAASGIAINSTASESMAQGFVSAGASVVVATEATVLAKTADSVGVSIAGGLAAGHNLFALVLDARRGLFTEYGDIESLLFTTFGSPAS